MLRTLIVDDEAPARHRLARLLGPFTEAGRLAAPVEATDGVDALARLAESPFDLVFLDVRMPELDGFETLDRMGPGHRPSVVFTTAYDEYALRAFEANAVDYLLKPIDEARLADSIERAERLHAAGTKPDDRLADLLDYLDRQAIEPARGAEPRAEPAQGYLEQLTIQGRDRLYVVAAEDLVAAEVHDGITTLYVAQRRDAGPVQLTRHLASFTLDALEARLDPTHFSRVHRGALVRLRDIREMIAWFSGRYKLVLTGGHEVIASRTRSRELRDRLSL